MIPKSGYRFSEKIMLQQQPVFGKDHAPATGVKGAIARPFRNA
jgi:hypothetical protein